MMARIRTIKPEFPQSESMGRVSRDARLLFIELWTLADDAGRMRGAPKMLASLLFPYDDDAPELIDSWLTELENEKCLIRYQIDKQHYLQIANWIEHQKIDKPTPSKIPAISGEKERTTTEKELETRLCQTIKAAGTFSGEKVVNIQRQVRVGSLYMDVVVSTEKSKYVLELKKGNLSAADLKQVLGYAKMTGASPILIGAGVSPVFPMDEARANNVAIMAYDGSGVAIIEPSNSALERSITFTSANECYPLDQGRDQGEEGKGEEEDARAREDSFSPQPSAVDTREQKATSPHPSPTASRDDGLTRIENHRGLWNSLRAGPPCKLMAISFTPDDQGACLRTLSAYSDEEIAKAMQNYVSIRGSPEHKVESPYRSFAGFMGRGVEKFVDEADPWNEYRAGRAGESTDMRDQVARVFAKMNQEGA